MAQSSVHVNKIYNAESLLENISEFALNSINKRPVLKYRALVRINGYFERIT